MLQFKYCYQISALIFLSKSIFAQICQSGALRVSPDKSGERLNGSVYVTFHNYGPNSCFDECIRRPRCHSFNYNMDSFHCEINEKPSREVFVSESRYEYVYISPYRKTSRDPCTSDCAEGEICITLYNGMCTCLVDDDDTIRYEATTHMTTESETTAATTTEVKTTQSGVTTQEKTTQSGATTEEKTTQSEKTTEEKTTQSEKTTEEKTTQSEKTTEEKTTQSRPTTESTTNTSSKTVSVSTDDQATTTDQDTTKLQDTTAQQVTTEQQTSADFTATKPTTNNNMTEKSTDTLSTTTLESTTA
ncbi:unnamed protein product [Mytilus edulis]|uniref:Apple domain-containing protein n=1 Tax=Mytilus edulis TaxID=6550 RepID=A0A8S3UCV7_MYTED|nr:unnamed protein product [Mytilus edulis]